MKNLNKKIIIASAIFLSPVMALAAETQELDNTTNSNIVVWTWNVQNSSVYLKWKIEWYKVILWWDTPSIEWIIWYKIIVINPDWTQKTISVQSDKNTVDNWDAKYGKNVYQLFVMWSDWELSKSNEITLNMWPNWWYDFSWETQTKPTSQVSKEMMEHKPYMMWSGTMTAENKSKMEYLRKSLEEQIILLRESITLDNMEEMKVKADDLKKEYLKKLDDIWMPQMKWKIEERFKTFYENNFTKREDMKKLYNDKKEQFENIKQDYKEKINSSETIKDMKIAKDDMKNQMKAVKEQFQSKKQDLKAKYKEIFTKKLQDKLSQFTQDKLKSIITKIDSSIEAYKSDESLTPEQKEKFVTQLTALKELLQDKLDEQENSINLDEIIN